MITEIKIEYVHCIYKSQQGEIVGLQIKGLIVGVGDIG